MSQRSSGTTDTRSLPVHILCQKVLLSSSVVRRSGPVGYLAAMLKMLVRFPSTARDPASLEIAWKACTFVILCAYQDP